MPFYTRPLLAKNQSARALGIFQRGDRPPLIRQGILTLGSCGRVERGVAQGGCACCAVRENLWVWHGRLRLPCGREMMKMWRMADSGIVLSGLIW